MNHMNKKLVVGFKQGDIIKCKKRFADEYYLFEFRKYDERDDIIFWQGAVVKVAYVAYVVKYDKYYNNDIYRQYEFRDYKGRLTLADANEKREFENAIDLYMAVGYLKGNLSKSEVHIRPYDKTTRIQLALDPPEYLYMKSSIAGVCIFKFAEIREYDGSCGILCKEMALVNKEIEIIDSGEIRALGEYKKNMTIRPATREEIALLNSKAKEKRNEIMNNKKLSIDELESIEHGTVLYGKIKSGTEYIFEYAGLTRHDFVHIIMGKYGFMKIEDRTKCFCSLKEIGVGNLSMFEVLRPAVPSEKELYKTWKYHLNEMVENASKDNPDEIKFKPFVTKVLVSNGPGDVWRPAIFGCFTDKSDYRYMIVGGTEHRHCILYSKNKSLIGKEFKKENIIKQH